MMNVNTDSELDFSKLEGLVAAVIQDSVSKEVLMVGFMNEQAYAKTISTGFVVFYSRSRDKLWLKGESSGHTLQVVNLRTDCDRDALVIEVIANGPGVCHEGYASCFFRTRQGNEWSTTAEKTFSPNDVYGGAQ
jgi:phosphoribosyl-AMP cyclohydrolase